VSVSEWGDFPGPEHQAEVMAAHEGQPPVAVQDRTHGAGMPAVDRGVDDRVKYA
jgi:hypothetical protein